MAQLLLNPRKRRAPSRRKTRKVARRRRVGSHLTSATTVKRYRRNPVRRIKARGIVETLKNGAIGACGAVLSEVVADRLPLPEQMKHGNGLVAAKALIGIGVGLLAEKLSRNKHIGRTIAEGSVTIALHDTVRDLIGTPLGIQKELEYYHSSLNEPGLLGYQSAAPTFNDVPDLAYYHQSEY